jgi:hypothetical protein
MTTELWKDIKGFEGVYQVSNTGKVRSLDRKVPCGDKIKTIRGQIIKQFLMTGTTPSVSLSCQETGNTYSGAVARLVLTTFHPDPPVGDAVPFHLDGNFKNNHISNLCWVPRKVIYQGEFARNRKKVK